MPGEWEREGRGVIWKVGRGERVVVWEWGIEGEEIIKR